MTIQWLGHAAFRLFDGRVSLVFDPYDPSVGAAMPRVFADIAVVSHGHHDHAHLQGLDGDPFVADSPGPWEHRGVRGVAYPAFHDDRAGAARGRNLVSVVRMGGQRVCHMGDIGHLPSAELLGAIRGVDVLLLPVGGTYTVGAEKAYAIYEAVRPRICVPMHYRSGPMMPMIDSVDGFLSLAGRFERLEDDRFDPAEREGILLLRR